MAKKRAKKRDPGSASPTKFFAVAKVDAVLRLIRQADMNMADLREAATRKDLGFVPALVEKRLLLVRDSGAIVNDEFLSLFRSQGGTSPLVRKVMFFVWAYRTPILRRFICEQVAGSDGRWRAKSLDSKRSRKVFEKAGYSPGSAEKFGSNVKRFLIDAGLYDKTAGTFHFELDDGWLTEAARIAAQHEPDPNDQQMLLADPAGYLIAKGWTALANCSVADLQAAEVPSAGLAEPASDEHIPSDPASLSESRDWDKAAPTPSELKRATYARDPVKLERAVKAHHMLEGMMSRLAKGEQYHPKWNDHIDLHFTVGSEEVIAEMKSCSKRSFHTQLRRGVSQLLEYSFLYRERFGRPVSRVLVMECPPPAGKTWLLDYTGEHDILTVWLDRNGGRFVTSSEVPVGLTRIVSKAQSS